MLHAVWRETLRRNPDDPYAWAMVHRRIAGRRFDDLPALRDIARDRSPLIVVQKSAQVGLTELMVSKALWAVDTGCAERGNVLYMMPTQNQMDDFARSRIDRAIQDSAYLRSRLQPEPPRRKAVDSMRLKRLGPGFLYMRGSDSRRQIASIDADLVILDEFDQMAAGVLPLARKRLASSRSGQLIIASTPRLPEAGVNELYLQSDQRRYYLRCPGCDLEQPLTWENNVDQERELIVCRACRATMDVLRPGCWVAQAPGNRIRGYHLSRLYSPWLKLHEMTEASRSRALHDVREFYNSDLGEVYSPPGGGLSLDELDRCRRDYRFEQYSGEACVMGVDVGRLLHVVIREAPPRPPVPSYSGRRHKPVPLHHIDRDTGRPPPGLYPEAWEDVRPPPRAREVPSRLWFAGTVGSFAELATLMLRYRVERCVIDRQPDMHKATEFARQHPSVVVLAAYDRREPGYEQTSDGGVVSVHADRTAAIDDTIERFRQQRVLLPSDARALGGDVREGLGEYVRELLAPKRTIAQDANENWVSRYVSSSRADHYLHAEVYAMLAAEGARTAGTVVY